MKSTSTKITKQDPRDKSSEIDFTETRVSTSHRAVSLTTWSLISQGPAAKAPKLPGAWNSVSKGTRTPKSWFCFRGPGTTQLFPALGLPKRLASSPAGGHHHRPPTSARRAQSLRPACGDRGPLDQSVHSSAPSTRSHRSAPRTPLLPRPQRQGWWSCHQPKNSAQGSPANFAEVKVGTNPPFCCNFGLFIFISYANCAIYSPRCNFQTKPDNSTEKRFNINLNTQIQSEQ